MSVQSLSTCRVCLASDREMYRLANTALEETYERVTSGTLVVEGRPCCVCGVCLSALRRCRRFIDTAREANDALDRWIRNQPDTDTLKLAERPLFSFTRSPMKLIEITSRSFWESGVKQESDIAENEDIKIINIQKDDENNTLTQEFKNEITSDDANEDSHLSDYESDENLKSHSSQMLSKFECVNVYEEMVDVEIDTRILNDVKPNISNVLGNLKTAPGPSYVGRTHLSTTVQDILRKVKSGKRIKLNADTEIGPAIKKRREITLEQQYGDIESGAALDKGNSQRGPNRKSPVINNPLTKYKFSCPQCGYRTTRKYLLTTHLKTHTGMFVCNECGYKCKSKSHLLRHLKTHTGEKPFACDTCDFKSRDKNDLKNHLRRHTDERPFVCHVCGMKFRYKNNFMRHVKRHTGGKPFACDKCNYKCSDQSYLKKHYKTHTRDKLYECSKCDFKCSRWSELMHHVKTHPVDKPYLCDKCDYKSSQKTSLKRHLMTHTGEKPFLCDKCDYKCTTNSGLKQHSVAHSTEKSFACDRCDYKCKMETWLRRHIMTHTGEKPFACDKCDFKSNQSASLRRHIRTHTGEKPFACDKCDYTSNESYKVRKHKNIHKGENLFACDKCDYKCAFKCTLIKHMRKVHV